MTERLRAAAERLRQVEVNAANQDPCWISRVYEWPNPRPRSDLNTDLRMVAMAYCAEHPADDSEPITADWLYTTSMEYCDIERKFIALDGDGHSLTYEAHGVMGWCFNGCSLHKQPRTRWELRRLADALGFDIKDGKA